MTSLLIQLSDGLPELLRDAIATVVAFCGALSWLALVNHSAAQGWLHPTLSRKVIHIGTGPLFVASWLLYSSADHARYLAALVPLILTARFLFTGLGWLENPDLVKSSTRNGVPDELLRGPLYYGIGFIVCTLLFWRTSPTGILALMMMCGGDGLADIIGRRFGTRKLPFSPEKSWAGSLAMLVGSMSFGFAYLFVFNQLGLIEFSFPLSIVLVRVGAIALVATLIEALPVPDIDNVTLTVSVVALSQWLLR
ncbi:MAG: phosphatidate cytidylyltransferase [Leptolyngbyaceae bacterium]|nr:phosphatidate cytidylyltransferase [Leptolyngbyaceae bacterium]